MGYAMGYPKGYMKILVIEDEPLFRGEMERLCTRLAPPGSPPVSTARNREEALVELAKEYDLVFIDLKLDGTGELSLDLVRNAALTGKRVVVTSGEYGPRTHSAAVEAGARSFIPKNQPMDQVARLLEYIIGGGTHFAVPVAPSEDSVRDSRLRLCTATEKALLAALANDLSNKQIAHDRGVSPETIKKQLKGLYIKLKVSDRREAVRFLRGDMVRRDGD
jgi:DNA-binding NarL/FixJ family response regulator